MTFEGGEVKKLRSQFAEVIKNHNRNILGRRTISQELKPLRNNRM